MKINVSDVRPEVVAAISAAVQMMTGDKVIAVRIKRTSNAWNLAARGGRH